MQPQSPTSQDTLSVWYVRSSADPNRWYRLTRRGSGPIECECAWAQQRRRSGRSLKPCRHVLAAATGSADARPARPLPQRAPVAVAVLRVVIEEQEREAA